MASGFRNNAGQDADDLYDPDTMGDGPTAPGFRRSDGSTLKYAAARYGTPGAAMGMRLDSGVDIGTQWARKGTATYALPINGATYQVSVFVPASSSGSVTFQFRLTSAAAWDTYVSRTTGTSGTPAAGTQNSGAVPNGATSVRYTPTYMAASGDTGPASINNGAAAATALAASVNLNLSLGGTGTSSPKQSTYNVKVEFLNSGGAVISTTNFTLSLLAEGSA